MRINLLAKRYAQALFDLALEMKLQDKVEKDMQLTGEVLQEHRELRKLLKNPVVDDFKKVKLLDAVFGKYIQELTKKFFALIIKKDREMYLEPVCEAYIDIYRKYNNILPLELTTAFKADKATKDTIIDKVAKATKMDIELHEIIDEELIGGFVINYEDYQFDASIKTQLKELQNEFSKNLFIKKL
jgi:F-type H+-transporting ATPase subunit delta